MRSKWQEYFMADQVEEGRKETQKKGWWLDSLEEDLRRGSKWNKFSERSRVSINSNMGCYTSYCALSFNSNKWKIENNSYKKRV